MQNPLKIVERADSRTISRIACLLLALAILLASSSQSTAADTKRTETYPDGAKKAIYTVDADGLRHGSYQGFYPDGKRKGTAKYIHGKLSGAFVSFHPNGKTKIKASYRNGLLHGARQELNEAGKLVSSSVYREGKLHGTLQEFENDLKVKEQLWIDGEIVFPVSVELINQRLAAIARAKVETVGEIPQVNAEVAAKLKDPAAHAKREDALRRLMAYRFICGVPYEDLQLDWQYTAHTVAGARIMNALGELTHGPSNPGWDEADYQFAKKGCGSSNISSSSSLTKSVDMFMDDSDEGNISRLGHRRWCLNPMMQRTGFGSFGKYSAMWSFDRSRTETPDYDCIAFPPRGMMPGSMFASDYAWSLSLNKSKYRVPDKESVKITVTPARFDTRSGELQMAPAPLPLNYFEISAAGFGRDSCIIFRPAQVTVGKLATYKVVVAGLQTSNGEDAQVEYVVSFF